MTTIAEDVSRLLASDAGALANPFGIWKRCRDEAPVLHLGSAALFSRYEDVQAVHKEDFAGWISHRTSMTTENQEFRASLDERGTQAFDEYSDFVNSWMIRSDGDEHSRLRGLATKAFSPRRIERLRPSTRDFAETLLWNHAKDDSVDMMDVAYRLPLMVIADMLGFPLTDLDAIRRWSVAIGAQSNLTPDRTRLLAAVDAIDEFRRYILKAIEVRQRDIDRVADPDDLDLLSALMVAEETDRLSPDELTAMVVLLLFAGHETTTNLLSLGLLDLLRYRSQWDVLCEEPNLVRGAVEELLRFVSPVQIGQSRVSTEEHDFRGTTIHAGERILTLIAAANRDPEVFERPDELDVRRPDASKYLAFGFGPRYCIGAALARLEAEVFFDLIATSFPDVQLTTDSLTYEGPPTLRRLVQLPVRLGRKPARPAAAS